ncbi:MAG: hypothetical protein MI747_06120, partial [Desulfobacterales bacterium]|nr:hypothetical protein [Desulfobacterales bacterium]
LIYNSLTRRQFIPKSRYQGKANGIQNLLPPPIVPPDEMPTPDLLGCRILPVTQVSASRPAGQFAAAEDFESHWLFPGIGFLE